MVERMNGIPRCHRLWEPTYYLSYYLFKLYFCGNRPPPYSYVEIIPGPNSSRAKTFFGSNPNHGVERKWPPTAMCGRGTAKVKASTSPPHRGTT